MQNNKTQANDYKRQHISFKYVHIKPLIVFPQTLLEISSADINVKAFDTVTNHVQVSVSTQHVCLAHAT